MAVKIFNYNYRKKINACYKSLHLTGIYWQLIAHIQQHF